LTGFLRWRIFRAVGSYHMNEPQMVDTAASTRDV
jgi:hypothetical protein